MRNTTLITALILLLTSCESDVGMVDAYGNFEAMETMISSEVTGKAILLNVSEGDEVKRGQTIGVIDTTQLYLKKQQLILTVAAVKAKMISVKPQIDVLLEQKQNLSRELTRFEQLKKDGAATQKQLDDLHGEMTVVDSKILATKTQLNSQNAGIYSEIAPLEAQIDQINDMLLKSSIKSPSNGTVLTQFIEEGELVVVGRPILKLADLSTLQLKAYVSGNQLDQFKLGSSVKVNVDSSNDKLKEYNGKVVWVASKAEFTPKIVQTREERTNLVYAIKVEVVNDGFLKIGMPGEVVFNKISEKSEGE